MYQVGDVIRGRSRAITMSRTGWYSIGMLTAGTGAIQPVQHNIHTDHEYARKQGLPAAIADGMHSTNWISALLTEHFGAGYIAGGALRTKYVRPVVVDVAITPCAAVVERDEQADHVRLRLDVWCEDPDGVRLTVGDASVSVPVS
jgi:3-hydroxybutyryl-CoA dehydratase